MVASSLIFAAPAWFLAIPAIALGGFCLWRLSLRLSQRRLERFFAPSLIPQIRAGIDYKAKSRRFVLSAVILCLLAIAMARPLTGPRQAEGERRGADLVIALDVSKSMWAEDVAPNRLEAVKKELGEWIANQPNDRIGLVLFSGKAFVQAPLTYDHTALDLVLKEAGPASISKPGSNIPEAIETAARLMNNASLESKILIIISDGENLSGDAISSARKAHQDDGLTIYTVGVGTETGARVPTFDRLKNPPNSRDGKPQSGQWMRSQYGGDVTSRLDAQALRGIASVGGGQYYQFRPGQSTFSDLRNSNISSVMEKTRKLDSRDYDEWFQIPLAAAMALIVLQPLLSRRKRQVRDAGTGVPVVKPESFSRTRMGAISRLLALALVVSAATGSAATSTDTAEDLLAAGKNDEAVQLLRKAMDQNPGDPYAVYNYALGLYRAGKMDEAIVIFKSVEGLATDQRLKGQALFQLGTISLRKGVELNQGKTRNAQAAARAFEEALTNYEAQMQVQSTREGRENLDTTKRELEITLLAIGGERTRANTESSLREAMQAYERAAQLNAKNQPVAEKAREILSQELARSARLLDEATDKAEAAQPEMTDKAFRSLFAQREQIASKLDEATRLAPGNQAVAAELAAQKADMAALLAKAAQAQATPILAKPGTPNSREIRELEGANTKLDQAASLDPSSSNVAELRKQVKAKLESGYLANGDTELSSLRKSLDAEQAAQKSVGNKPPPPPKDRAEGQLQNASAAADYFTKALGVAPENTDARQKLEEVTKLLPDLYAKAGRSDVGKVEAQLAGKLNPENPKDAASASELRTASAALEKALQNLNTAATMKPDNAQYREDVAKAEALMGNVRTELDKQQSAGGEQASGEQNKAEAGSPGEKKGNGQSAMRSMNSLRPKDKAGSGNDGEETKRKWDKFVQDW